MQNSKSTYTGTQLPVSSRPQRRRNFNRSHVASASATSATVKFPVDYPAAIRQAQDATNAALNDGFKVIEIEFPTASLASVAGDAEGANEMTYSMNYIRQYLRIFQQQAETTRVFFPDQKEMIVAKEGKGMDPNAGSWTLDAVFEQTKFKLDFLTKPNGLSDLGFNFGGFDPSERVKDTDKLLIAAYPHFDPREMIAVEKLYNGAAVKKDIPLIIFNGELDRIRTGYYPPIFYPKIGKMAKNFIPKVTTAYYIHNFKGNNGGALFRAYPGPWQVYVRSLDGMKLVHTQEEPLTLKEVALDILPKARRTI